MHDVLRTPNQLNKINIDANWNEWMEHALWFHMKTKIKPMTSTEIVLKNFLKQVEFRLKLLMLVSYTTRYNTLIHR